MSAQGSHERLTPREKQVLAMSGRGLTDKEIARELGLSPDTVHTYWSRIRKKTGTASRAQLVGMAVQEAADSKIEAERAEKERLLHEIARRRRAEEALAASERELSILFDECSDGIVITDDEGRCTKINARACDMLGCDAKRVLGTQIPYPPATAETEGSLEDSRAQLAGEFVVTGSTPDETVVELRGTRIGESVNMYVLRDVTERKRMEEAVRQREAYLRAIVENLPVIMHVLDKDGVIRLMEGKGLATVGIDRGQFVGKRATEVYDYIPGLRELVEEALAGRPSWGEVESPLSGRSYSIWSDPLFDPAGKLDGVISISTDVTAQRATERALREGEALLRTVVANMPMVIFAVDMDGRVTLSQGRIPPELGLSHGEAVGASAAEIFAGNEQVLDDLRRALEGERIDAIQMVAGRHMHAWLEPMLDDSGKQIGVVGVAANVTAQVEAEQALRKSEAFLRGLLSNVPVGIFSTDMDGKVTLQEGKSLDAMGIAPNENVGRYLWDVFPDSPTVRSDVRRALAGERAGSDAVLFGRRMRAWLEPAFDATGAQTGIVGVAVDVTEQVESADVLRKSEALLRTAISNMPLIMFAFDMEGRITLSQGRALAAVGLTPSERVGRIAGEIFPNDKAALDAVRRSLQGERVEVNHVLHERHMHTWLEPVFEEGGMQTGVVGVSADVTEQVMATQAIRDRDAQLHAVISSIPVTIFALDRDGRITVSIGSGLRALGIEGGTQIGESVFEIYTDSADALDQARRALNGESMTGVTRVRGRYVQWWMEPQFGTDGSLTSVVGVAADVTEQEEAAGRLRYAEAKARALTEATPTMIFHVERDGRIIGYEPTQGFEPLVPPEFFMGKRFVEVLPPGVSKEIQKALDGAYESGQIHSCHYQLVVSGELRDYEGWASVVAPDDLVFVVHDVTDYRAESGRPTESALQFAIHVAMPDVTFLLDQDRVVVDVRAGVGFDPLLDKSIFLGKPFADVLTSDFERWTAAFDVAASTGSPHIFDYERLYHGKRWRFKAVVTHSDAGYQIVTRNRDVFPDA